MTLLADGGDAGFQNDMMRLVDLIVFQHDAKLDDDTKGYILLFAVRGCIAILQKWLQNGAAEPVSEIAGLITRLSLYGNSAYMDPN